MMGMKVIPLTDPNDTDSDEDGLTDGYEANTSLTDPNNLDTDLDGFTDGHEVNTLFTDPNSILYPNQEPIITSQVNSL